MSQGFLTTTRLTPTVTALTLDGARVGYVERVTYLAPKSGRWAGRGDVERVRWTPKDRSGEPLVESPLRRYRDAVDVVCEEAENA